MQIPAWKMTNGTLFRNWISTLERLPRLEHILVVRQQLIFG